MDSTQATGWAWLDTLGANVSQAANAWLTAEVASRIQASSVPAVAAVPNSAGVARDSTLSGKADPNALQRYALYGAVGVGVLVIAVIALRALKR